MTEEEDDDNPLITPCKCSGSMRFVHHECLRSWFQLKRQIRQSAFISTFYWSGLECELCKTLYPSEIKTKTGHSLKIIEYETPRDGRDYLVLESISSTVNKVIHVVDLYHCSSFFIGRGQEADVRIKDITVSR